MTEDELTIRDRVLAVVERSALPQTARTIAEATQLTYKQTIDALNALLNHGRVERRGRKNTARWFRVQPRIPYPQFHPLDVIFFRRK